MIRAYQEIYLNNAQSTLGDAFDYAINACNISGNDFTKLFVASSASKRMENGEPAVLKTANSSADILTEEDLKKLMMSPKYWKEQDPATLKKVSDGFKRLYPSAAGAF